MPGPLTGHTALVTGATAGIGAAITEHLAAHGATVVLAHLDDHQAAAALAKRIARAPVTAVPLSADLRDPASVHALCQQAHERLGPIDILVSNAGAYPRIPWAQTTPGRWREALATNLTSHYLLAHELTPTMTALDRVLRGEADVDPVWGGVRGVGLFRTGCGRSRSR